MLFCHYKKLCCPEDTYFACIYNVSAYTQPQDTSYEIVMNNKPIVGLHVYKHKHHTALALIAYVVERILLSRISNKTKTV